jgi:hypothetical protein
MHSLIFEPKQLIHTQIGRADNRIQNLRLAFHENGQRVQAS